MSYTFQNLLELFSALAGKDKLNKRENELIMSVLTSPTNGGNIMDFDEEGSVWP